MLPPGGLARPGVRSAIPAIDTPRKVVGIKCIASAALNTKVTTYRANNVGFRGTTLELATRQTCGYEQARTRMDLQEGIGNRVSLTEPWVQ